MQRGIKVSNEEIRVFEIKQQTEIQNYGGRQIPFSMFACLVHDSDYKEVGGTSDQQDSYKIHCSPCVEKQTENQDYIVLRQARHKVVANQKGRQKPKKKYSTAKIQFFAWIPVSRNYTFRLQEVRRLS
jgi:hypothetical protein